MIKTETFDYSISRWPIILAGLILIGLVSGCSGANPAPSGASQGGGGNMAPAQSPSNSGTAAVANPSPPAQEVAAPYSPPAGGQYETPPIVNAGDLLPESDLSGSGFYVQRQVPTNGAMGQYIIVADASVFHDDAGSYQIESLDLLKIRLSEIPAIAQLDNMSQTGAFAKEFATSAARPVTAAAQMVIHPMDTVTGLPSGIGEFFGRVDLGAKTLYSTATNSSESGGQRAAQTAGETGAITLDALGYDQVRRDLARKLHVDPYSSDPVLTKRLNHMAWVMFSARIMVNTAVSVAVPGSMLITGVEVTDDLIYQTPKGDLILLVQNKLKKIGLSPAEIATFTHNTAIPLSLQVAAVRDLESLGNIPGRRAAANTLGGVMTEYQARFLVTSLRMLAEWSAQTSPITKIKGLGVLVAHDQNGDVIVPAPVDYLSWTPRIAGFATDPELLAMQNRVLWIPAKISPMAQQQLIANGWTVHTSRQP
jgi:hypothetical protein